MKTATLVLFISLTFASSVTARTWFVSRDGQGDYSTIQPALDQAAIGDTVLIGPGRYAESHATQYGWNEQVCAEIRTPYITVIGSGADKTVIGPASADGPGGPRPVGIAVYWEYDYVRIENLAVENLYHGVHWRGRGRMRDCVLRNNEVGLLGEPAATMKLENVLFESNHDYGATIRDEGGLAHFRDCDFLDNESGLRIGTGGAADIESCSFRGGVVGLYFGSRGTGAVRDCSFSDMSNYGVVMGNRSETTMTGARIEQCGVSLLAEGSAVLSGSDNIFMGGSYRTLIFYDADVSLQDCHILNGGSLSVEIMGNTTRIYDLSHNWWGTTDETTIRAWIHDGNDDPDVRGFVEYRPLMGQAISNENRSWGDVKILYR